MKVVFLRQHSSLFVPSFALNKAGNIFSGAIYVNNLISFVACSYE